MTEDKMIEVMQAFKAGKSIEWRRKGGVEWQFTNLPRWNFHEKEYRVKPEKLEVWVTIFETPDGLLFGGAHNSEHIATIASGPNVTRIAKFVEA